MSHRIFSILACLAYLLIPKFTVAASSETEVQNSTINLIEPISMERMLFQPLVSPLGSSKIALYNNTSWVEFHEQDHSSLSEIRNVFFSLLGEYRSGDVAFGFGLPLVVSRHDIKGHSATTLYGNELSIVGLRLNARYTVHGGTAEGWFLTLGGNVAFPSNRFLYLPRKSELSDGYLDQPDIERYTMIQTTVAAGIAGTYYSIYAMLSPSIILKKGIGDSMVQSASIVIGLRPFSILRELSLVLQADVSAVVSGDVFEYINERPIPISIAFGARYEICSWFVEVSSLIALHDAGFYLGDHSLGFGMGYRFDLIS